MLEEHDSTVDGWPREQGLPCFGSMPEGLVPRLRPGAYGILQDVRGRVAVVGTSEGWFLPGGGAEAGESPEDTLRREVREECGFEVTSMDRLTAADQLTVTQAHREPLRKRSVFFRVRYGTRPAVAPDPGHDLRWLAPAAAAARLTHESHAWAVRSCASAAR